MRVILQTELLYHAELTDDGAILILKSELLYHPELKGRSLGLMGPRVHQIRTPITLNSEDATCD